MASLPFSSRRVRKNPAAFFKFLLECRGRSYIRRHHGSGDDSECGYGAHRYYGRWFRFGPSTAVATCAARTGGLHRRSNHSHPGVDEIDDDSAGHSGWDEHVGYRSGRAGAGCGACGRCDLGGARLFCLCAPLFLYMSSATSWAVLCVSPGVNCGPTLKKSAVAVAHRRLLNGFNGSLRNWIGIPRERLTCRWARMKPIGIGGRDTGVGWFGRLRAILIRFGTPPRVWGGHPSRLPARSLQRGAASAKTSRFSARRRNPRPRRARPPEFSMVPFGYPRSADY
jgi:hypothetical protein